MFKKSFIPVVLIILACISCDPHKKIKSQLEGVWIERSSQFSQNDSFVNDYFLDYKLFLNFKDNEVRMVQFGEEEYEQSIDTTINFKWENDKIILWEYPRVDIEVAKDSLIMTSYLTQTHRRILKKLPENSKKVNWNPSGKQYKVIYDVGTKYFEFTDDSTFHSYTYGRSDVIKNQWKLFHLGNHTILTFGSGFRLYNGSMLIDSLVGNKVFVTDYTYGKKYQPVLEEQAIAHEKPTALYGTWKLVAKEEVNDSLITPFPIYLDNFDEMRINKDSIVILKKPFKYVDQWKYYESANTIVLRQRNKIIQVQKLTKDSLVVGMELTEHTNSKNKQFVLVRE
jgi:hypothetical protein